MSPRQIFIIVVLLIIGLITYSSFFTVNEKELAIKFRLGEIEKADYKPGLYFQVPFVNNVVKYERRILMLDARPTEFLTVEKKKLVVDFYSKWRIRDIEKFYRTMSRGDINTARDRVKKVINNGLKSQFSQYTLTELVSGQKLDKEARDKGKTGLSAVAKDKVAKAVASDKASGAEENKVDIRALVMSTVTEQASREVEKYGIEIVDIRIKRIDLTKKIETDVFARMTSEREQFAAEIRASGKEISEKMRANADKQRTIILAQAYEIAEQTRGQGDAKSAEIYANAYGQDKEFYAFYRSLDAYKKAMTGENDVLVLEPDSDFFRYFKQIKP